MGEVNTRRGHTVRRYFVRSDPGGLFEIANHGWDNRIESGCLFDGRIKILKLGNVLGSYGTPSDHVLELGANFFENVRVL